MSEEEKTADEDDGWDEGPSQMQIYLRAAAIVLGLNVANFLIFVFVINVCNASSFQVILTALLIIGNLLVMDWIRRKLITDLTPFLLFLVFWAVLVGIVYTYSSPLSCSTSNYQITCNPQAGYSCIAQSINTTGSNATLTVLVGQSSQADDYNIGIACVVSGLTSQYATFQYPSTSGTVSLTPPTTPVTLSPGTTAILSGIVCYQSAGVPISNGRGSVFIGTLYLNYTATSAAPGPENPWLTTKLGTLSFRIP